MATVSHCHKCKCYCCCYSFGILCCCCCCWWYYSCCTHFSYSSLQLNNFNFPQTHTHTKHKSCHPHSLSLSLFLSIAATPTHGNKHHKHKICIVEIAIRFHYVHTHFAVLPLFNHPLFCCGKYGKYNTVFSHFLFQPLPPNTTQHQPLCRYRRLRRARPVASRRGSVKKGFFASSFSMSL